LFIDAIVVKIRDEQVINRAVYVVIGVMVTASARSSDGGPTMAAGARNYGWQH
jgi:hypothetical protein